MNEIRRVLRAASIRLIAGEFLNNLIVTLTAAAIAALAVRLVEPVLSVEVAWGLWLGLGAGAACAAALAWALARAAREAAVARVVDERAALREALSTALCVERSEDPWARVVVEEARRKATGVDVRRTLPVGLPRTWPVAALTAMLVGAIFALGPIDLFGVLGQKRADEARRKELFSVRGEIAANENRLKELLAKAKVEVKPDETAGPAPEELQSPQRPEEIKLAAVKQLTNLAEKLDDLRAGEKAQQDRALKEAMKQLRTPGEGPLTELSREMARGNFGKAREQLDELSRNLADAKLSPEERQKLAEQLKNLAAQLEKIGSDQNELAKKLEQGGLDPKRAAELAKKLAENPDALKDAIEQMKNLSEEQKKKLMEMAKALSESQRQCQGMSRSMSQMAQGMGKSGMSQSGMEGMEGLGSQLGQGEMLSAEMDALGAALEETQSQLSELGQSLCEGGACEGEGDMIGPGGIREWRPGDKRTMGNGSGGPGRGNGPSTADTPGDYKLDKTKAKTTNVGGPIIGSRLVYGDQIRGESQSAFAEAVESSRKAAAEAIETRQIDREFQSAVKAYFGALERRAAEQKGVAPPAPPAEPAKDAGGKP